MRRLPRSSQARQSANRAEEVRKQRDQRGHDRANRSFGRSAAQPARPITFRGSGMSSTRMVHPVYSKAATSRPRHAFYLSMDSRGAEIRLPAIPLVNPGWRLLSFVIVVAAVVGIFSMLNSDMFRVAKVEIQGLKRINAADVNSLISLENLSIVEVQPAEIQKEINTSFPELADVNVAVELPNFVTVSVRERQPVLSWNMGDVILWVDAEGVVFPKRGEAASALVTINTDDHMPLIPLTGGEQAQLDSALKYALSKNIPTENGGAIVAGGPTRQADMRLLSAALQLAKKLPEGTQIVYDKANGLGWTDPGGWQVFIGKNLEDFDAKFATYQAIIQTLQKEGIKPQLVSVEHPNAPFYRAQEEKPQE